MSKICPMQQNLSVFRGEKPVYAKKSAIIALLFEKNALYLN
jgi:hypothetical protein